MVWVGDVHGLFGGGFCWVEWDEAVSCAAGHVVPLGEEGLCRLLAPCRILTFT